MDYYRGDTFVFQFELQNEEGQAVNFEAGDIVKFGMKKSIYRDEYAILAETTLKEDTSILEIECEPHETQLLEPEHYVIELELTRGDYVDTIYQETILVKGDVIRNDTKTNSGT